MSKSIHTIRRKKHEKHPLIIVFADKTKFGGLGLTHSDKSGHSKNIPLKRNPDPNDIKPSYAKKKIIYGYKFNFSKAFANYKLSEEDAKMLLEFIENKKKQSTR